ncbi:hypothetical protein HZH68_006863 [Vespula germanica]|uniref:Uncharacterized protein n=1 Tax=Vespula germanica TaxID=30212 RepID=A0A834KFV9_VESGE|nr:hypothetical protein HZH68_006863 [Vespula germanica]
METIIELMQIFLPNLCFSVCYWNLNYNIMKVKEMLDRINSDWVMLENQRELMIMQKYAKIGRLCTLAIAYGSMFSIEEDYIDNEYYAYNLRLFKLIGLWEHRTSLKQLVYICIINIILVIGLTQQVTVLINE